MLPAVIIAGLTWPAGAQDNSVWPLKWEVVEKPSIKNEIVVVPSEINRMAASHDIVYAVDTANKKLHRSDNGGLTFEDITSALANAGASMPVHEIGVAPDRPQYVAVSDDLSRVFWSNDSGVTWSNAGLPAITGDIQCIAISNGYREGADLFHDLAVGTAEWGDAAATTTGQIWTIKVGQSFASWQNQGLTFPGHPGAEVSAIAFSPQYISDSTILAVVSTAADLAPPGNTFLCIGQRDLSLQTTSWNGPAGYPLVIDTVGDAPGVSRIVSTIALPSDYNGTIATSRKVFVSYNRQPDANDDVYRFDDVAKDRLGVAGGGPIDICSIAYFGTLTSGKLLAGAANQVGPSSVPVWRTLNPLGTPIGTPNTTTWNIATQPPSGPGNAQVGWSYQGTVAFCGTGRVLGAAPLDESSFSQSYDNGDNWEQTSLINTLIRMCDITPAPDSRSLFMATFNAFGPEAVWRSAGEPLGTYWARMYTMRTFSNRVLLRLSPDYSNDYTIYAVEAGSGVRTLMAVSKTRGNTWKQRNVQGPVIDLAVASKDTLYIALPGGLVRKSTDGGLTWGDGVMTGLDNVNMLAVAGNGDIFAGSTDSEVAYSTDKGASFMQIEDPIGLGTGCVQVAADADYVHNNIIYAADNITGKGAWRWTIGLSTEWEQIDEEIASPQPGQIISGLMAGPEGTLYVLRAERPNRTSVTDKRTGTGGMNRTLDPAAAPPVNIEWDIVNRTLTDSRTAFDPGPLNFTNNPPWLKLSGNSGENVLWAVDTANLDMSDNTSLIYRFQDTLCKKGPWTTGPPEVGCDPVSGRNQGFGISWEQLSLSDRYDLQVAKDPAFTLRVDPAISNSDNVSSVTGSIKILTDPVNVTSPALWLDPGSLPEAGADYFWRVRTYHTATWEFIRSPWSATAHFFVKPGFPVASQYLGQQLLSPEDGSSGGEQSTQQSAQAPAQRNGAAPLWAWIMIAAGIIITFILSVSLIRRSGIL